MRGGEGIHAGVDLGDGELLGTGVLVLDDAGDLARATSQHAAVARGIGK